MSDLSLSSDFSTGAAMKGNKISILAFEVSKTILKGSRLMQSLSDENISFLKTTVLSSKGVQTLISEDNDELMRIAAADKRWMLEWFCGVVDYSLLLLIVLLLFPHVIMNWKRR